jgi:hypothetical protein
MNIGTGGYKNGDCEKFRSFAEVSLNAYRMLIAVLFCPFAYIGMVMNSIMDDEVKFSEKVYF